MADRDTQAMRAALARAMTQPPGRAESAVRGAMQGVTAGWSDELAGALKAAPSIRPPPEPGRTPGPRALAQLYPGVPYAEAASRWFDVNRPDLRAARDAEGARVAQGQRYAVQRDEERAANAAAGEAHPVLYRGGEMAGALAGPAPAATGLRSVLPALGSGAAFGVGDGTAETPADLALDAAKGAGLGLGFQGLGELGLWFKRRKRQP